MLYDIPQGYTSPGIYLHYKPQEYPLGAFIDCICLTAFNFAYKLQLEWGNTITTLCKYALKNVDYGTFFFCSVVKFSELHEHKYCEVIRFEFCNSSEK